MKKNNLKIFIIAGEVSGDVLGEKIIRALPREVKIAGVGGENMERAGSRLRGNNKFISLFPMSDLAVMGVIEVLGKAKTLTRRIAITARAIEEFDPDIVLTIDSPGFAKRVIKRVRGRVRAKFYHVVAPQVWAWGARRAKKFAKIFDRLYAFFDFEKPYFTKYGLDVVVVGHPIADGLVASKMRAAVKNIALIPGSRMSEIKKLLPIYRDVVGCCPNYKFFIPVVETTKKYIEKEIKNWRVQPELVAASARYKMFAKTDIAIAASGTVSAELAIMHTPAIVVYKMNKLTELLARLLVKIKWVSLVNILAQKSIYPELLGSAATAENIVCELNRLKSESARVAMIDGLAAMDKKWRGNQSPAEIIVSDIVKTTKIKTQ